MVVLVVITEVKGVKKKLDVSGRRLVKRKSYWQTNNATKKAQITTNAYNWRHPKHILTVNKGLGQSDQSK